MFQSFRHREACKGAAKIGNFRCLFGVDNTSAVFMWSCWVCILILVMGRTKWNLEKGTAECNISTLTQSMPQYEPGYLNRHAILWAWLLRTGAEPLESLLNPSLRWSHEKELLLGWICHANGRNYTRISIPRRMQSDKTCKLMWAYHPPITFDSEAAQFEPSSFAFGRTCCGKEMKILGSFTRVSTFASKSLSTNKPRKAFSLSPAGRTSSFQAGLWISKSSLIDDDSWSKDHHKMIKEEMLAQFSRPRYMINSGSWYIILIPMGQFERHQDHTVVCK